ncbi:SCARECROW-like 8 [Actinidia rufa]|uniref:SCARECROW-like 8 n=1 Tax=Actinidia rufa TaxID=165716 RepID=A0A7J0FQX0_9ERIC|nr:SCARECROW-like 8 [Actinidia rufa]
MSSGFSGDFFTAGGFTGRPTATNNPQNVYNLADPASRIHHRRPDLIGKRALAEFQAQQQLLQQQQALRLYLRNVKPRTCQNPSPICPLSADFSASVSPDISSISSTSVSSSPAISTRYGRPILQQQQIRPQPINLGNGGSAIPFNHPNFSGVSYPNLLPNRGVNRETGEESEKKMMNRLHELEKQLFDDNEEEEDTISVVTNSEWSETIQNLIGSTQKPISPTSSSSSCSSSSASPQTLSPKQSLIEAATAICEGKTEVASEILTRLNQVGNIRGTAEQRLTAYMVSALRSRMYPMEHPPPVVELYSKEHAISTQLLYKFSPCFKLGFMAANLAILEATSDQRPCKLHVVDFDIGQGCQYVHLIHALAARKADNSPSLKITTFTDFMNGGEEKLKLVGDELKTRANEVGIRFNFNVLSLKTTDLSLERLCVEENEVLAVNFAFRLYKVPDESVTTENLRDELLRRVRGLSPAVVTVVEQEMNANTAPFMARVTEACGYYGAVFDSLDATVLRDNPERVRIEEGLSRKAANSVACEGRDRIERCEVFGKWRARMGMAGFNPKPLSPLVSDSLRTLLNSGTCGNPGFTVKEETGRVCFGWMGRTLTVASAWR